MNNQTNLPSELNQAQTAVLAELSVEASVRAICRGLALDELCDWRNRLYVRLDDIDWRLSWIPVEKCAKPACRTSSSPPQWVQRALQILERSWIGQVLNRRLCHDKH